MTVGETAHVEKRSRSRLPVAAMPWFDLGILYALLAARYG